MDLIVCFISSHIISLFVILLLVAVCDTSGFVAVPYQAIVFHSRKLQYKTNEVWT